MKVTLKAVLIGTGVIFGLQLVLAILIKVYAEAIARAQTEPLVGGASFNMLYLGVSLGTFFIGGLIVGFMEERLALGEPVVVAVLAMALSSVVSSVFDLPDNLLLVTFAQKTAWGAFALVVAIGLVATVAGGLIGERIRVPTADDPMARTVVVIALALVLAGPFYLLGLPWYVAVIATLVLLVLVGVGYYLFTQGPTFEKSIEEISISPERHRES